MESEAEVIRQKIDDYKAKMRCKCKKFSGSATSQVIRNTLMRKGFNISQRDVYIQGVPIEIDLLMLKEGVANNWLYYDPQDVLIAFEIKCNGSYGENTLKALKNMYDKVKEANNRITCLYLTIFEKDNYKHRATRDNCPFHIFEVFLYPKNINFNKPDYKLSLKETGDFERLIKYLTKVRESNR